MKVIILAGGLGTRLGEQTEFLPKPMLQIGGKPIIWHIMQIYAREKHKDFYLALGYKSEKIKEYFLNYNNFNSDLTIDLLSGIAKPKFSIQEDWRVTLVDTGSNTMTGGRAKRMKDFIGDETCLLTYGDGVADIDIDALIAFHKSHGKLITMTAVRPPARFGELHLNGSQVIGFKEKPQLHDGWINGGFFVIEPKFFDFIDGDETMLEREPIERAVENNEIMAFRHEGFWHCVDTKRDLDSLQSLWSQGAPWLK
jgi:glucose-1-phosphate cytidylyltransferase